jgi:hypothetical protein
MKRGSGGSPITRSCDVKAAWVTIAMLAFAPPANAALSLGVTTPLSAMTITPGTTATASEAVLITPDPLNPTWHLSISDGTGNNGHLARGTSGCTGVEAQTVNPLSVQATGTLPATVSSGAKTVTSSTQQIAQGNVLDTVNVAFSLVINSNEILSTACTMSTTITYTLQ